MAKHIVRLEFHYDSEESIMDYPCWNPDLGFTHVTTPEQAILAAQSELETFNATEFSYNVYDEEGELLKTE